MDDIFDLLTLKKEGYWVFVSSEFRSWVSYVEFVNSLQPKPFEFELISQLKKHYGSDVFNRLMKSLLALPYTMKKRRMRPSTTSWNCMKKVSKVLDPSHAVRIGVSTKKEMLDQFSITD